jgi:hypothetical protein
MKLQNSGISFFISYLTERFYLNNNIRVYKSRHILLSIHTQRDVLYQNMFALV